MIDSDNLQFCVLRKKVTKKRSIFTSFLAGNQLYDWHCTVTGTGAAAYDDVVRK